MRILILGGTIFLGRHVTEAALARGHEVTLFTRGLHGAELFPEAERVRGDRADVSPLRGRSWDAIVDTSGYAAEDIEASARLDAGHYVFVSTCNVYPDWPEKPVDDDSATWESGDHYGAQKALGERAAERVRPGRFTSVRAGTIVGPHDNVFRLPWWVRRVARGGVYPAFDPATELQLIDARDLAGWMLDLAERGAAGTFNATAPIGQIAFGELLALIADATGSGARPHHLSDAALEAAGVQPWTELPLWAPWPGTWRIATERARAAGLRTRPVGETVRDVAAWLDGDPELPDWRAEHRPAPLSPEREAELLAL